MKLAAWITVFYAILLFAGGVIGNVVAGSMLSLMMGTVFGILLIVSAIGMFKNHLFPAYIAVIFLLLLDAFFTFRFLATFAFMPAGLFSLITLGALIAVAMLLRNHLKNEREQINDRRGNKARRGR